jgi:UDP-glucose 4-epimerase
MRRFLITGGCGFIGSHLHDRLTAAGHAVRVIDDLSSGHRRNLPSQADVLVGDINDAALLRQALDGVDGCFHLAAIASVERGVADWLGTHRTNLTGTIAIFDAIRRLGRPVPVVYASSAAVYGDCPTLPITEDATPRPLSAYGADKRGCELHALVASHGFGIPTFGLRFFNVYGPRQDPKSPYSGVISIFCDRLRRGEPVDVYGDGEQTRDFVFVADIVEALVRAMDRAGEAPQSIRAPAEVMNVCTGVPVSVRNLADTIASLLGHTPTIRFAPPRAGEIRHSTGAPERVRATLGLGEPVALRDGLAQTLAWLDQTAEQPA